MNPWLLGAIIVGAVGYVIVKRLLGEPLNARDLAGPPLILTGIGIYELTKVEGLLVGDYLWLAGGIIVGLLCGGLRGSTVVIFTRNGVLWQRYTGRTFLTWVATFILGGAFALLANVAGMNPAARPIMLTIGISMIGEMITLGLRAVSTGRPFSPQRKDSAAAHRDLASDVSEKLRAATAPPAGENLERSPSLREGVGRLFEVTRGGRDRSGR